MGPRLSTASDAPLTRSGLPCRCSFGRAWQSTRGALSFNRRSLVEGIIGANRFQNLNVNRGFFLQTRVVAIGMLLAITLIGHNLVRLDASHTVRGRPEPWQVHLGEPIDDRPLDKATRTRGRRKRSGD